MVFVSLHGNSFPSNVSASHIMCLCVRVYFCLFAFFAFHLILFFSTRDAAFCSRTRWPWSGLLLRPCAALDSLPAPPPPPPTPLHVRTACTRTHFVTDALPAKKKRNNHPSAVNNGWFPRATSPVVRGVAMVCSFVRLPGDVLQVVSRLLLGMQIVSIALPLPPPTSPLPLCTCASFPLRDSSWWG